MAMSNVVGVGSSAPKVVLQIERLPLVLSCVHWPGQLLRRVTYSADWNGLGGRGTSELG